MLERLSPSLQRFEIEIRGDFGLNIVHYPSMRSMSSEDYINIQAVDPALVKENIEPFVKALSKCNKLYALKLPITLMHPEFMQVF